MEKTSILTKSGNKTIILPAYYKDTEYEDSHYLYKVYKRDGELICLRIKLIQIDSFFTADQFSHPTTGLANILKVLSPLRNFIYPPLDVLGTS